MTPPPQQPPQGQQPPPQPPPPQDDGLDDAALAVAVAALLAAAAVTAAATAAAGAAVMIAALKLRFTLSAVAWQALGAILVIVTADPPPHTGVIGAASEQTSRMNMARRAQFVLAAARRVTGAVRDARAKNEPAGQAIRDQLERERRFYEQHKAAMWNRAQAAGATDMAAAEHGNFLGWNAILDSRTSAACRSANGWNYYATSIPNIGWPGSSHPACRCWPSAPHRGGRVLPGSHAPRYARAAA
jgi:hypothetical protein